MSKVGGFTVILEQTDDEAVIQNTLGALRQIKGVLSVVPVISHGFEEVVAKKRASEALRVRLQSFIKDLEEQATK